MKWNLWVMQALTIMKTELKRYVLARRWLGVYAAAYAPVALLLAVAVQIRSRAVDFGPFRDVRVVLSDVRAAAVDFLFVRSRVFAAVSRGDPGEDSSLLSSVACAARSDRGREIPGGRFRTRADFLNEYDPDEHTDLPAQLRWDELLFRRSRVVLSCALRCGDRACVRGVRQHLHAYRVVFQKSR